MKIKRIQVKNIGPYVNENAFDFDVSDITKRMVLIGGKNGAGKTTLFNAIKICLYGCVAYGFESNNAKYFAEIEKIINANEKLQKIGEAEVVIDLLMDDGKYDHTYTFVRSWRVAGKKIAETFTVYKDGETLSETEKSDFESYLLQTLPPNLFRFYFFDGEKISDFVFNSSKNSDFKDAFLKLCSLDTMEIIRENFRRISRSKAKGTMTLSAEYDRCLEADNLIAQRVECAEDEYREISNEILIIDQRLASLEKAYAKGGGISKKEWRSMQDQIAKEDARREGHHKWLKELANNVLPFIILRTQLEELKSQIALEHKAQVDANVKSTIDTPEIKSIISGVLSRANIELADDISEKVIYEIASYASHTSQITPILNLSDFDRFELTAKINSLLAYDTNRVKEAIDDIKASLKCVKRIRKKMERSSIENYDYPKVKVCLDTSEDNLIDELYTPCLKWAERFDRGVGYFTTGWLTYNVAGLSDFASRGGKMRLITSPILSTEDTDAIIGAENQDGSAFLRLEAALLENVEILKQEMEADIINAFSWMLYDGIIDMRFAIPCEKLEEGDFHDKFGIFYKGNDALSFSGSINDSKHGFQNYESIKMERCRWKPLLLPRVEKLDFVYLSLFAVFLRLNLLDALCLTVSRRRSLWTAHPMKLMKRFATYIASMNWMRFWPQTRESLPKSKTPKESVEHPAHLAICVPGKVTLTQFGPS